MHKNPMTDSFFCNKRRCASCLPPFIAECEWDQVSRQERPSNPDQGAQTLQVPVREELQDASGSPSPHHQLPPSDLNRHHPQDAAVASERTGKQDSASGLSQTSGQHQPRLLSLLFHFVTILFLHDKKIFLSLSFLFFYLECQIFILFTVLYFAHSSYHVSV